MIRALAIIVVIVVIVGLLLLSGATSAPVAGDGRSAGAAPAGATVIVVTAPGYVATGSSARMTAMWAGATGTAAYLAPTQAALARAGTSTAQALARTERAAETQAAATATDRIRTERAADLTATSAWATAIVAPRLATLALLAAVRTEIAAQETRSAQATLAAADLRQQLVLRDAATIFVIALGVSAVAAALTATWALTERMSAEHRARAQATVIAAQARAQTMSLVQTSAGALVHVGDGDARILDPGESADHGLPIVPRAPIPVDGGRAHLDLLTPEQREMLDFLAACRAAGMRADETALPGRDRLGMGGDQHARYLDLLTRAGLLLPTRPGARSILAAPLGETMERVMTMLPDNTKGTAPHVSRPDPSP